MTRLLEENERRLQYMTSRQSDTDRQRIEVLAQLELDMKARIAENESLNRKLRIVESDSEAKLRSLQLELDTANDKAKRQNGIISA